MMMHAMRAVGDRCNRRRPIVPHLLLWAGTLAAIPFPLAAQPRIELVSITQLGRPAEGRSDQAALSFDGRFVAYVSNASNLIIESDERSEFDLFVRDRELLTLERITIGLEGAEPDRDCNTPPEPTGADGSCIAPAISADGRIVVFASAATNLVGNDTNGLTDVFAHDRTTHETVRISVGQGEESNGVSGSPDVSADGRYVVYQSVATNLVAGSALGGAAGTATANIFLHDRTTGETRQVTNGNGSSITPSISGDGRVVAFISAATNLIEGDGNGVPDVYVTEVGSGNFERASVSTDGAEANRISFLPSANFDGSLIAFKSEAFNLVPNDTNGVTDVFVRDRGADTTERISVDDFGNESNGLSGPPSISHEGCDVAFPSAASDLVLEDKNERFDLFVVDRCGRNGERRIARIGESAANPLGPNGEVPDAPPSMSPNGQWVGFASTASDLAANDTNNELDVFITGNPLNPPPTEPTPTPTATVTETPEGFCEDSEDCPPPQVCVDNMCVDPTPTVTPPPPGFCNRTEDCPAGQVCVNNRCVTPTPTATPIGFCDDPSDCPPGQVCVNNQCVTPTRTPTPDGFCDGNEDCPPGQVCDTTTNRCITATPTPTATRTGMCDGNEDCPPGQVCDLATNMCVASTPTPGDGDGDGGGCSCEIDPRERAERPGEALAILLPAAILWLRRRSLSRRPIASSHAR